MIIRLGTWALGVTDPKIHPFMKGRAFAWTRRDPTEDT